MLSSFQWWEPFNPCDSVLNQQLVVSVAAQYSRKASQARFGYAGYVAHGK